MEKHIGLSAFRGAFEGIHYSHELGQRKPEPEAFLTLCRQHRLDPSNTLFIDDSEQHVAGAARAGLQTHWHNPVSDDVAVWLREQRVCIARIGLQGGLIQARNHFLADRVETFKFAWLSPLFKQ